jgi:hypothetical protein
LSKDQFIICLQVKTLYLANLILTEELIETHRCYNVEKFERFAQSYGGKVELCVMDTNIQHDFEWFRLYN